MIEDRAARGCGDHVISNGESKWRYEEADSIVNPQSAERCALRARNEFGHEIPDGVGKHREDNAADNVPTTDVQIGEPGFKKWQDKFEDHQNEGQDDESVYDERKLCPL